MKITGIQKVLVLKQEDDFWLIKPKWIL